jgi:cell division protein FtsZ
MEMLTVGIVTSPLVSEGKRRWKQAMEAIAQLEQNVDALLVIDNDNVVRAYDDLPLHEAFSRADDVLSTATRGIAEIVTRESDLVGVDFADVAEVMRNCGRAHMSVTSACGENRVDEVLKASLCSPLLGHQEITGAKNILLNFSVPDSDELKTREVKQVLDLIQRYANGIE